MTVIDELSSRAGQIREGDPDRDLLEHAARAIKALRHRLWIRRHQFNDKDHAAMNLTVSLDARGYDADGNRREYHEPTDTELGVVVNRIIGAYQSASAGKIAAGDVTREGVAILREVII